MRFRETIEALHDDGFRVFIESGAARQPDLVRRGHPARPPVGARSPADLRRRSGTAQLSHLVATLAVHGVELDAGYLFEHRGVEPVDWRRAADPAARRTEPRISLATTWPTMRATPELIERAREDALAGSARRSDAGVNGAGVARPRARVAPTRQRPCA